MRTPEERMNEALAVLEKDLADLKQAMAKRCGWVILEKAASELHETADYVHKVAASNFKRHQK